MSLNVLGTPVFECRFFSFDSGQIEQWENVYPGVPILIELRKMEAWLDAHPEKHYKRYKAFVVGWLGRRHEDLLRAEVQQNVRENAKWAERQAMSRVGEGPR